MISLAIRLVLALVLLGAITGCSSGTEEEGPYSRDPQLRKDAFDEPRLRMPRNGSGARRGRFDPGVCGYGAEAGRGTLRVSVPPGRDTYFVRLVTLRKRLGPQVIVRPGRTVDVEVDVCGVKTQYRLDYGAGRRWYGYHFLFGPTGAYNKADEVFPFERGTRWTVSLSRRVGGNLGSSGIDYQDFVR